MQETKYKLENVTRKILTQLSEERETSPGKAVLANLRNSINKELSNSESFLPILFRNLPEEFLSRDGELTETEKAIIKTLQLYALHQQGNKESVLPVLDEEEESTKSRQINLGVSLRELRDDDSPSMDRRFNIMITSENFEELFHHLRQMIKLLKSRTEAKVDYVKLSSDLYDFIRGYKERVRIRWAERYYQYVNKEKGENENGKEK